MMYMLLKLRCLQWPNFYPIFCAHSFLRTIKKQWYSWQLINRCHNPTYQAIALRTTFLLICGDVLSKVLA